MSSEGSRDLDAEFVPNVCVESQHPCFVLVTQRARKLKSISPLKSGDPTSVDLKLVLNSNKMGTYEPSIISITL